MFDPMPSIDKKSKAKGHFHHHGLNQNPRCPPPALHACMHARANPKQQHPQDTDEWYLKNITVAVPKRRQILYLPSKKPPTATWRQLTRSFFWLRYFSRFHWRGLKMRQGCWAPAEPQLRLL